VKKYVIATAAVVALATLASIGTAAADGRTVAYLQGAAFAIAANCKHYSLDTKAIALSKNNASALGIKQGNTADFANGVFQFHELLNGPPGDCRGDGCSCETVCNFRPGTCYFLKDAE
jgi:hypothetical protein